MGAGTQHGRLLAVKAYFRWMARQCHHRPALDCGRAGPRQLSGAAPRADPSERYYRTRLLPGVLASKRSQG